MSSTKTLLTSLIAILLLFSQVVAAEPQAKSVLYSFDGSPQTLADYTGKNKWTVVMFWASDCLICGVKAPDYVKFQAKHKDEGMMHLIGVSVDGLANKAAAQGFIDEHQLNFPNLIGDLEDVANMYYDLTNEEWRGTPTFFIYDRTGKLRVAQAGAVPIDLIEEFINTNNIASAE